MARKLRRSRLRQGALTANQESYLQFGPNFARGKHFASESEARAAWVKHRAVLMASGRSPGARPWGYFRFELNLKSEADARWFEQLRILLERKLIEPAEAAAIEQQHAMLSPDQSPEVNSSFDGSTGSMGREIAESIGAKFALAARWHGWRGRPELEQRYQRRAASVIQRGGDSTSDKGKCDGKRRNN